MAILKYKTKNGIHYRASFVLQGKKVTLGGFLSREEAQDWILREKEKARVQQTPAALCHSVNSYLKELVYLEYSKNTIRYKHKAYTEFLEFSGQGITLPEITTDLVKDYHRHQRELRGNKAANRYLRELSALFSWLGYIESNPCRRVRKFPEEEFVKCVPAQNDVDKILEVATQEEKDLLIMFCFTAGRLEEILSLIWEDVDLQNSYLRLHSRKGKRNRKSRAIYLGSTAKEVLKKRYGEGKDPKDYVFVNPRTGTRYHRNSHAIKFLCTRLCKKANVKFFTLHGLRHFVTAKLMKSGKVDLKTLQKFLGHNRLDTTGKYAESIIVSTEISDILEEG